MPKISEKDLKENGIDAHIVKTDFGIKNPSHFDIYESDDYSESSVNKYYFEFAIYFDNDYDVGLLENLLGVTASRMTQYKDSKGDDKKAKFIFKTEILNEVYPDYEFKKFVKVHFEKLKNILSVLNENNGSLAFYIVFTELYDKPIVSLDKETIHMLSELDADFDVDYA